MRRNRIGAFSLAGAGVGFLFVLFQPWIPLDRVTLINGLNLKGLLSAFFDASLVGALADWFAVSALFRNPLGVKLPHTDILAQNKDAIAEAVPRFLTSFVSEERIAQELGTIDFAAKIEALLAREDPRAAILDPLRNRLASLLGGGDGAPGIPVENLAVFVREALDLVRQRLDPATAAAGLILWARGNGFDSRLIDAGAGLLREGIAHDTGRVAAVLTPLLKRNAGWQKIFISRARIERFLEGAVDELDRVRSDPHHELRPLFVRELDRLQADLAGGAQGPQSLPGRLRSRFQELLQDEAFISRLAESIGAFLTLLRADLERADGVFAAGAQRAQHVLQDQLGRNADFRGRFNRGVATLLSGIIARGGLIEGVTGYLATLLKNTDEREFVRRIEGAVWNDLQYIRVNGAVVGGLVGVVLWFLTALLPP